MLTHAEADHEGAAPEVIRANRPRIVVDGGAGWPSGSNTGSRAVRSTRPGGG